MLMKFFAPVVLSAFALMPSVTAQGPTFKIVAPPTKTDWDITSEAKNYISPITFDLDGVTYDPALFSSRVESCASGNGPSSTAMEVPVDGSGFVEFTNPLGLLISEHFCAKVFLDFGTQYSGENAISVLTINVQVDVDGNGQVTVDCDYNLEVNGDDSTVTGDVDQTIDEGGVYSSPMCGEYTCSPLDTHYIGDLIEFDIHGNYFVRVVGVSVFGYGDVDYNGGGSAWQKTSIDLELPLEVYAYFDEVTVLIDVQWTIDDNDWLARRQLRVLQDGEEPTSGEQKTETTLRLGVRENSGATKTISFAALAAGGAAALFI
jgi:hypothetical protein